MGLLSMLQPASVGSPLTSQPTGLLDLLLGNSNPVAQFADNHANLFGALGAGIASGPSFSQGLANAAQMVPQAKLIDQQTQLALKQQGMTYQYLAKKYPDLAAAVQGGMPIQAAWTEAMKLDHPTGVVAPPGSAFLNPNTGAPMNGAQPPSGFYGSDIRSQAWNIVMRANSAGADPAMKQSPDFQAAWSIINTPVNTPNGTVMPAVPANWGPNAAGNAAAPAPAAPSGQVSSAPAAGGTTPTGAAVADMTGGMPMIAPPALVQSAPGTIPGTKPFNESQSRMSMLIQSATPDLKRVIDGFPSLMNFKDQVLQSAPGGIGRIAQSPQYKQTIDAMTAAMSNLLYVASGANLNAGELQRKVQAYVPAVGDDPQTAVNKLDRFANDIMVTANATKDADAIAWAKQAVQGIKATEQQMLQGQADQSTESVPAGTPIYGPDGKQYIMGPDGTPQPVM